jgi:hypothetical protein
MKILFSSGDSAPELLYRIFYDDDLSLYLHLQFQFPKKRQWIKEKYMNHDKETFRFVISGLVCFALIVGYSVGVSASELGHFAPALLNIRDTIQPPPGTHYAQYHLYYTTDTLRDKDGNKINSITIGQEKFNVETDVDSFTVVPTLIHITDKQVLGANLGFLASLPVGNTSVQAALESDTNPEFGLEVDESGVGMGDPYVRPVWLGWNFGQTEITAAYGLYIPIGKYDKGDADNVGLGMWTHELMVSGAYYFDEQRVRALTMSGVYEIHHNKDDVDIRPGSHFTLNYGFSQYLPLNEKVLSELGIAGYGQWQLTEDKGSDATNKDVKDQVYGLGLQAGLMYLPLNGQLSFKWIHEFEAEDRFEGDFFTLTIAKTF